MLETRKMYETRVPYTEIKFRKLTNFPSYLLNETFLSLRTLVGRMAAF